MDGVELNELKVGEKVVALVKASACFDTNVPCVKEGGIYTIKDFNRQGGRTFLILTPCESRENERCGCKTMGWHYYYFDVYSNKFTEEEVAKAHPLPSAVDVADFLLKRV